MSKPQLHRVLSGQKRAKARVAEDQKVQQDFVTVCTTYSSLTSSSNKIWLVAAVFTLLAIVSDMDVHAHEELPYLFPIRGELFFPALALVISLTNLHFLVVISQCFFMQSQFFDYLSYTAAASKKLGRTLTLKDLAHQMNKSGLNRLGPLFNEAPAENREKIMEFVKPISDTFYVTTPAVGILFSLLKSNQFGTTLNTIDKLFVCFVAIVSVASIFATSMLVITSTQARKRLAIKVNK
jgi:hypothetical protein